MTTILALTVKLWLNSFEGIWVNQEDIRTLTRISRSLWGDFNRSLAVSEDTLSRIALLRLSDDLLLERVSKAMIEKAEQYPPKLLKLTHPFFRLAPIERFLLTTLHIEKWGYARIARTLGIETDLIESWAWATRIKYCFQEMEADVEYPRGPSTLGTNCPEYNASAPWAQRLLDDELGKRERLFLQNHLMACTSCRKTLEITRKMMFKIETMIPVDTSPEEMNFAAQRIDEIWKSGEAIFRPTSLTLGRSLLHFLSRPKVQFIIVSTLVFCLFWLTRSH